MAAVTSAPVLKPTYNPPNIDNPRPRSPAGFTAVNGRDTSSNTTGNPLTSGDTIVVSSERYYDPRPVQRPISRQRSPSPQPQEQQRDEKNVVASPAPPPVTQLTEDAQSNLKRKRSPSPSVSEDQDSLISSISPSGGSAISIPEGPFTQSGSPPRQDTNDAESRPGSRSPANAHYRRVNGENGSHDGIANDNRRDSLTGRPEPVRSESQVDLTDAQMAEALQHDPSQDPNQPSWNSTDRSEVDPNEPEQGQYGAYATGRSSQDAHQRMEKRKRIFSNRTKTGCMTCRKRKKKCDEAHPACNNCLKGGFQCAGYSSRNAWQKAASAKPPVPLEAKKDLDYIPYANGHGSPPQRRDSMRGDGRLGPIVIEDHENPQLYHSLSPQAAAAAAARPRPAGFQPWPQQGPPPYPEIHRDLPSIHNIPSGERPKPSIPPISELRRLPDGRLPDGRLPTMEVNAHWHGANGAPSYSRPLDPFDHTRDPNRLHMPVRHEEPIHDPGLLHQLDAGEVEKDKMLRGEPFRFMDNLLSEERTSCRKRLCYLNKVEEDWVSEHDDIRLEMYRRFKHVLIPSHKGKPSHLRLNKTGKLGPGIDIQLPFRCHYGYNIELGEDIYIGENCNINDALPVIIGTRTWIGSNVTIFTATALSDLQERQGSNSLWKGKPIRIGHQCWIGPGVTIYPGVELGSGCYVEAGEVVKKSWPDNSIVGEKQAWELH